jgi:hypothetical protein
MRQRYHVGSESIGGEEAREELAVENTWRRRFIRGLPKARSKRCSSGGAARERRRKPRRADRNIDIVVLDPSSLLSFLS